MQKNQDSVVFFSLEQLTKETKENAPEEKFANINKGKGSLELERIGYHVKGCSVKHIYVRGIISIPLNKPYCNYNIGTFG